MTLKLNIQIAEILKCVGCEEAAVGIHQRLLILEKARVK